MINARKNDYYDWAYDLKPEIIKNLNELLVAEGTEPLTDLHGGKFLNGKWVSCLDSKDYRNYWHVYLELFAEGLRNDQFLVTYFPHPDNDEEWDYCYNLADEFCEKKRSGYEHSDPHWARHLVTAVREMLKDNDMIKDIDGESLTIWWSW